MKKITITLIALIFSLSSFAQSVRDFDGVVAHLQRLYNNQKMDSVYYLMSDRGKKLMTAEKFSEAMKGLYSQYGAFIKVELKNQKANSAMYRSVFEKELLGLSISLNKENQIDKFRFVPYQDESTQDSAHKEKSNFEYKSPTGSIYGTLTIPDGSKKFPVLILIAGSGPTDRNCNNSLGAKTNAFIMMADSLKNAGIATLRYDKRGVGESSLALKDESTIRFDDYINDAVAIIKMLKEDNRFSEVYVLGHSEGSLIGMIASGREKVAGYISLAGPGKSMDKLIVTQLNAQSKTLGARARSICDSIKAGHIVESVPTELQALFRSSVQAYLASSMKYNPQKEIKKLKIPTLILQGATDLQVSISDAKLLKKGNKHANKIIIEGMNHVLKQSSADRQENFATYNKPTLPLCPGLMPHIIKFIKH